ncbi:MAG: PqqD family protein [Gammaproteobacteria bacterium]|nr:PqqD family protein [Gammaproteobacteria bacterium]
MLLSQNYKLSSNITFTELDDEMVLLDLNKGTYFGLNPVGAEIMLALLDNQSAEQAGGRVADRYGIELTKAMADTEELLASLLAEGLISQHKPD